MVEILRVIFALLVIICHIRKECPEINSYLFSFFHTSSIYFDYAVEMFFMIGGFFLYRRIQVEQTSKLIFKTWERLIPALLIAFIILACCGVSNFKRIPVVMALTAGTGIHGSPVGWGDYYCGVYFWCTCLFAAMFCISRKGGWIGIIALMYLGIMFKYNIKVERNLYFDFIGRDLMRGILNMGFGMVAAFIAENLRISRRLPIRMFCTVVEVYCLYYLFTYMARTPHAHISYWEMDILAAILLISICTSAGYISSILNKCRHIQYLSRYAYATFVGQMVSMGLIVKYKHFGWEYPYAAAFVMLGAIAFGILEYHLVEKKLVPKIRQYVCS